MVKAHKSKFREEFPLGRVAVLMLFLINSRLARSVQNSAQCASALSDVFDALQSGERRRPPA